MLLILIIQTRFPWHYLQSCGEILFFFLSLSFPLHVFGKISRKTTMKLHENYPDSPTRILVLWKKKIFTPNGTLFFFSSGRKEGMKRSNTFVSVQHCCIKEPHKNNKKKFSVKGNLQPIPKINKMEWKIQNLFIILTVKCSNFNRLPFKYKLILCYNMYNAQLSGLQDPNIYWPPFRLPNMIFPVNLQGFYSWMNYLSLYVFAAPCVGLYMNITVQERIWQEFLMQTLLYSFEIISGTTRFFFDKCTENINSRSWGCFILTPNTIQI